MVPVGWPCRQRHTMAARSTKRAWALRLLASFSTAARSAPPSTSRNANTFRNQGAFTPKSSALTCRIHHLDCNNDPRVAKILERGLFLFAGDQAAFQRWLNTPDPQLSNV